MFAGEKTEPATEKRRRMLLTVAMFRKSQDLSSVLVLLVGFLMLRYYGGELFGGIGEYMRYTFSHAIFSGLTLPDTLLLFNQLLLVTLQTMAPFMFAILISTVYRILCKPVSFSDWARCCFDIRRMNPISGIQNIFFMETRC